MKLDIYVRNLLDVTEARPIASEKYLETWTSCPSGGLMPIDSFLNHFRTIGEAWSGFA